MIFLILNFRVYEAIILAMLILNSVIIASYDYENKSDPANYRNYVIDRCENAFSVVFALDSICKILAMGLVWHPNSYLRSGWSIIDLIVVISGYLTLIPYSLEL